jgi:hypothetical protein
MKIFFLFLAVSLLIWQPAYAQETGALVVQQNIRNLTQQNFVWANTVIANPTDRIELQIVVKWNGAQTTNNVLVRETLDQKLLYQENLKLDGAPIGGNITTENINIGSLESNQSKTITFEATVQPSENFSPGTVSLINTSTAFNTESADSVVSKVQVAKQGGPTDISTGPLTIWMIVGFFGVLIAAIGGVILYGKYYVKTRVLESTFETRVDRKLATSIQRIQKKEKKG